MIKYHYLCGGILSILIAGTALPLSASATDAPIPVVKADARPSVSQLEAAIATLKSTGSYQAYFIDQTLPFDASTPHYSEYNYLKKLVHDLEIFVTYYDELPTDLLQDALRASKDAASGCTLILNGQAKLDAAKKSAQTQVKAENTTTSKTPVASTTATAPTNKSAAQKSTTSSVATPAKSNQQVASESTASQPTPAPAVASTTETPQPEESKQATDSSVESAESNPVAVPATGEVESHSEKSPLPLFAAIIAGAAAASIIIAAVLHRQPKSRSRRF